MLFAKRLSLIASVLGVVSTTSWNVAQAQEATVAAESPATEKANTQTVRGVLRERGTKKPLPEVNVFLLPAKLRATTDGQGRFEFADVPEGEFQLVVNASGYRRLEQAQSAAAGSASGFIELYLERQSYQGFETTVVGRAEKRDDTTRSLRTDQFLTLPGAGGDPVKAVQNLPGVARPPGASSVVVIQGSAPEDTSYLIDDQDVPLVFHFGGLTSVITPEAVGQVDYLSAGYGPEYGRAMGGLIGLKTRDPARDRLKGFAFLDTTKAGGLVEGPIGEKSSFLLTARYSYLGAILKAALKGQEQFDLTVAPSFGDITGLFTTRMNDKDEFRLLTLGSRDELKFLFKEPLRADPAIRGEFSNETSFYRVIPQWTRKHEGGDARTRVSAGLGQDMIRVNAGDNFFDLTNTQLSQRAEHERKLSPSWNTIFGADNVFSSARVNLRLPTRSESGGVGNPITGNTVEELRVTQNSILGGAYARGQYRAPESRWTLMPSARVDYFSVTDELLPAPRLAARLDETEHIFWRASGGLYYQPPEPQQTARTVGNPDLSSPRAWHLALGREQDFRKGASRGLVLTTGLFYRYFDRLVVQSSRLVDRGGGLEPERFNNEGRGDAVGAEVLLRVEAAPWSGWVSYTLSQSRRQEPGQPWYPFEYDQTHNLNVVGSVDLDGNWKLSGRVRYVTGNPRTPITGGVFDADNDVHIPLRGPFFSERLDPFFQVDLRADKKWIYESWILWAYLDIQNVTNNQNEEGIRYAYDYSERRQVTGLPILPTIGLRGDF